MPAFFQFSSLRCLKMCFYNFHSRTLQQTFHRRARSKHSYSSHNEVIKDTTAIPESVTQDVKREVESKDFVLRCLRKDDIPKLMQLRREIGVHDVRTVIQTWLTFDPEGIKIIENKTGFLGIRKEYRNMGLGEMLTQAGSDRISKVRNCGMYVNEFNTAKRINQYRIKFSANIEKEFKSFRNNTTEPVNPEHLSNYIPKGVTIEPFNMSHLPHVFAYDHALIGYKRERILELNCQEENSRTFVAFKNGVCVGFGSIKTSCLGAGRVGPLYADDPVVAEVLLRNLVISLPKVSSFAMMTVSNNADAKRLLQKLSCPQTGENIRLYRGERMKVDTSKVFAHYDVNFSPF